MNWKEKNQQLIQEMIHHLELGKAIGDKNRKPISKKTVIKYRTNLNYLSVWFGKDFKDINQADVDKVRTNLMNDVYKNAKGTVFQEATKLDIEGKFLKSLLRYVNKPQLAMFGNKYNDRKEITALSKEQVDEIVNNQSLNFRNRLLIQFLFDTGFRASELLNVTYADVKDDELASKGIYKVRCRISKTIARTVGLLLPLTNSMLRDYLKQNKDKIGTNQKLFDLSYRHFNLNVRNAGLSTIKQKIHPHLLRHSSATYFCRFLNQYQLCKRYGWHMASDMPRRYIDTVGVDEDQINTKVINNENNDLIKSINALQEQLNLKNSELENRNKEIDELNNKVEVALKISKQTEENAKLSYEHNNIMEALLIQILKQDKNPKVQELLQQLKA